MRLLGVVLCTRLFNGMQADIGKLAFEWGWRSITCLGVSSLDNSCLFSTSSPTCESQSSSSATTLSFLGTRMSASEGNGSDWAHTVTCVSAGLKLGDASPSGRTRSLRSSKNNPLLVKVIGKLFWILEAWITCLVVSTLAPRALSKVLDRRNGVLPGTMAIFKSIPCIGTTIACLLWRTPWFPNRNVTSQGHLLTCFITSGLRFCNKSGTNSLPITVLVAPKSTMPKLPWDAKNAWASSATSETGCGRRVMSAWARQCKRSRTFQRSASILTAVESGWHVFCQLFKELRSLSLGLRLCSTIMTCTHGSWGTSKAGSWTLGSCKNSRGKTSGLPVWESTTPANVVGAWGGLLVELVLSLLDGHSAFQWPTWLHNLQRDSRILCCSDFLDDPWPLENFPFTPLKPRDLPLPETGQNPLWRTFSLRRLRASVYAV